MTVADSLIYPQESDTTYPYTDTGDREFLEDKEFIETMTLVTHLAAVTSTLRFTPFVLKLPVRPPVLVAKQASSIAFLSGGRLGLGVGLSPWPEDFAAMGVPWARRGKRMDECIDILRGLWTGDFFAYSGEFFELPAVKQTPAPPSKIPLLVGGHSDAALRRAVRKGDGWMHAGGDGEELDRLLTRLAEIRKEEGDTRDDFEVHVISFDAYSPDGVKRLEDRGVTDCIVGFRVPYIKGPDEEPLEEKVRHLEKYAADVIAKVAQCELRGVPRGGRRGGAADLGPAVRAHRGRAGRGRRLPRRADPLLDPDGLRPRRRPPRADQPHTPVRPPGTRQPRRDLLQRAADRRGVVRRARASRDHHRPLLPGDGRDVLRRGGAEHGDRADDRELDVADGTFGGRFGEELGLAQGATLIVREVFSDWVGEERGTLWIERTDTLGTPRPAPTTGSTDKRFGVAAKLLTGRIKTWFAFPEWFTYKEPVNTLTAPATTPGGLASQFSSIGHYALTPDEALVVTVPACDDAPYQAIQVGSRWYASTDYEHHQTSLTRAQSHVDADGMLRYVVTERDPGLANWLETTGHERGVMMLRWQRTARDLGPADGPSVEVVPFVSLATRSDVDSQRVIPDQYAERIAARQIGVARRMISRAS